MLKTHMAACLVATALAAAPAFAQAPPPSAATDRPTATGSGSTNTGSSAMQPSAGTGAVGSTPSNVGTASGAGTSMPQTSASNAGSMQGHFLTQIQPNQMMASKVMGTTVVGPNNESIGDVNDIIVDRNGQVTAVVVGVGGFLGIGEKDVAVPFQQLELVASQHMNQQTSGTTPAGGTTGTNTVSNPPVNTTGSTATSGSTGSTSTGSNASGGVPDRIMLRMTKAELQAAPTFARSNRNQSGDNAGSSVSGGTTAPKP
jgi:sporulation protein YlmC with PRC-barrel domain